MKKKPIYILILFFSLIFLGPSIVKAVPDWDHSYDVIIDVGHGGIDGGTSFNEFLEKDINLSVGIKLYEALNRKSYQVGLTRIKDYALSDDSRESRSRGRHRTDLSQRKLIANTLRPKTFVSLHVNWSKNNKRRGPVVIYQASEESYTFAHIVQSHLNEFYGVTKKPLKGNKYFLMNHLEMPSIIVEMGYLSNEVDRSTLTDESMQDELVTALTHAIEEYLLLYPANEKENIDALSE